MQFLLAPSKDTQRNRHRQCVKGACRDQPAGGSERLCASSATPAPWTVWPLSMATRPRPTPSTPGRCSVQHGGCLQQPDWGCSDGPLTPLPAWAQLLGTWAKLAGAPLPSWHISSSLGPCPRQLDRGGEHRVWATNASLARLSLRQLPHCTKSVTWSDHFQPA